MFKRIFIANRGEIALRISRAAADMGLASVVMQPSTDTPAAYLDVPAVVAAAVAADCDAVHPGYGFLSERADFAQACADVGLVFIGATPAQLRMFGNKARARSLAVACDVPVLPGSDLAVSFDQAQAFFTAHVAHGSGDAVVLKALSGGGGRGMRVVRQGSELLSAYGLCVAEAEAAFGVPEVYVEKWMPQARHVEVQVIGDGVDVMALGERECTLQRRFQKLVEIAPSPTLSSAMRQRLVDAALEMARACSFLGLGTFEFLVNEDLVDAPFVFIEANPRLQVEHTITEQVMGLDLVQLQMALAARQSLAQLGLDPLLPRTARGFAIQWRIGAERLDAQGTAWPAAGVLSRLDWPAGPGIRIDTAAKRGALHSPQFDSLLAKLVVSSHSADFADVLRRSQRALAECVIEGVHTNLSLLRAIAARPEFANQDLHTHFVETHAAELMVEVPVMQADMQMTPALTAPPPSTASTAAPEAEADADADADSVPEGSHVLGAPLAGRLAQHLVAVGEVVAAGTPLALIEAMKMQHELQAPHGTAASRVVAWLAQVGDVLVDGQPVVVLEAAPDSALPTPDAAAWGHPHTLRPDLQALTERHAFTLDSARPQAIAARHQRGLRSARENIADLCDDGSFNEYGALAVAAQRSRRSAEDLMVNTPADGMVVGTARVNGKWFSPEVSSVVVMAYDATVLAGTQGMRNHQKTDRMLGLALRHRWPVVLFAEGGGGRPGDTDMPIVAGLHVPTFASFARLSGQVPTIGIAAGRCFAGNAALLGCCDVIIATQGSNIGMGGPAMIEGGGLGVFAAEEVGPAAVQSSNGVIDALVADEAAAVAVARQVLSYFQSALTTWTEPDSSVLRQAVPTHRQRVYDVRPVLRGVFDAGSVLELRAGFGVGVVTALARLQGRAVGVLANNPQHLGGAIDPPAADKAARFMQLCNAHGLPLVSLIDTPGFMVGPEVEKQAQVRHASRLFVTAAALRVPFFSVVLRKAYGLGAMGMAAGGFHEGDGIAAWPTGEFGAMGLEGAVRLGYRKELAAAAAGVERQALFDKLLAEQVEAGSAMNMASTLEIDAVIDPADTRAWLARGLAGAVVRELPARFIDTW
jgi:acetyl-CoA carboxylase carboxyltransferase component/acetyl/propionyl-CoA carboxylase alpha subunit